MVFSISYPWDFRALKDSTREQFVNALQLAPLHYTAVFVRLTVLTCLQLFNLKRQIRKYPLLLVGTLEDKYLKTTLGELNFCQMFQYHQAKEYRRSCNLWSQIITNWVQSVECVYWTEPKATCRPHRNPAKCV
jgi:hypothetical protein